MIHAHFILPQGLVAALIKRIYKVDYILTAHGGDVYSGNNLLINYLKKISLKGAGHVVSVSSAIKEKLLADYNIHSRIVPMGVCIGYFGLGEKRQELRGDSGKLILFVGRLVEKKGIKYLIEAMPEVLKKHPDAKLKIIGIGDLDRQLKEQVRELRLQDNVEFLGYIDNNLLPDFYASADVFVGPSVVASDGDAEGLGLVFVEAMSAGVPVISSDFPAIGDVVINEKTGLTTRQKDSRDIANVIIRLFGDNHLRESIVHGAHDHVKSRFDWSIITERYVKLLGG